jgi:hypothetical protein
VIRYVLHCEKGHTFESWFPNSAAYDKQVKRKLVSCPGCGSTKVEKAIMAPQLARTDTTRAPARPEAASAAAPAPSEAGETAPVAMISPQEQEFRQKLKELHDHLTRNSDNVGKQFPEEARKIHYGESEHRSIHGEASLDDAKAMAEEGIEFFPLPPLPDERN